MSNDRIYYADLAPQEAWTPERLRRALQAAEAAGIKTVTAVRLSPAEGRFAGGGLHLYIEGLPAKV